MNTACALLTLLLASLPPGVESFETPELLATLAPPAQVHLAELDPPSTVGDFLQQHPKALVAINGGFFDRTWSGALLPTGLVVADGRVRWPSAAEVGAGQDSRRSSYRKKAAREARWYGAFLITRDGVARVLPSKELPGSGLLTDARLALESGPMLVRNGRVVTKQASSEALRTAVGVSRDGRVILLCTREEMTLVQLAKALVRLGAVEALNLDGGPSSSFASRERAPQVDGQKVQNALYIAGP
jgi:exopolysaccharide biosynthesis protein